MKRNIATKTARNDFSMPVFGIGTWMMGGDFRRDPANDDDRDINAIRRAINAGITHIDTAEMYAEGHAEEIVGRAISRFDRSRLCIVSKVWNTNLSHDNVLRSAEASLSRLGTGYLDLYLIHKPNDDVPLDETLRAMDRLVDEGMVRNIGMSNFSVKRMRECEAVANHPVVATQVHYNIIFREPETTGLLDYCRDRNILLIAWRPVQKGILSREAPPLLRNIAGKYGRSPAQIAINWLIGQDNVVTMSTMRSREHLDDNLGALGWKMTDEDMETLRRDFPGQQDRSDVVPLS